MIWDSTLNKPIFSNGSAWIDAVGNPVYPVSLPSTYDTIRAAVISKLRLDPVADKTRVGDWMFMIS